MKKVNLLIAFALVIISGCVIYLFTQGASLRSGVLIRPSVLHDSMADTAQGVFYRLFPEFQNRQMLVVGADGDSPRVKEFLEHLRREAETFHKNKIQFFNDDQLLTSAPQLSDCNKNCWIITETQSTSDIAPMPSVLELAGLGEKDRFTLSIFEFDSFDSAVIPECEKLKRLTLNCLKNLAIKEAQRKMKDPSKKYFFLRQYNGRDYFLFLQK